VFASATVRVSPAACSAVDAWASPLPQSSLRPSSRAAAAAAPRSTGAPLTVQATAPVARPVRAMASTADSSAHFWYALGKAERCTRCAASVTRIFSQPLIFLSEA
jgi:hypothetical protein